MSSTDSQSNCGHPPDGPTAEGPDPEGGQAPGNGWRRVPGDLRPIAITPGEPSGIGPDLVLDLAARPWSHPVVAVADPDVLRARARQLGLAVDVVEYVPGTWDPSASGQLAVIAQPARAPVHPGKLDPRNSPYVLDTLRAAARGCLAGQFAALVTGPVHKSVINDAGIAFSGHTEFFADIAGSGRPVMMLAAPGLRVALATTHLPLARVSAAITPSLLTEVITILHHDLRQRFDIATPRILVCGLNPHAGESGHLGREEIEVLEPTLHALRQQGYELTGPLPADTAFTPPHLAEHDAVLAMFHDQGLPVLKFAGFGEAVNITLGLPFIRTSVDHGTALDLAGTGKAQSSSLAAALSCAMDLAARQQARQRPA